MILNQVVVFGFLNGFQFVVHLEFVVDVFDMLSNGTWRQEQIGSDDVII